MMFLESFVFGKKTSEICLSLTANSTYFLFQIFCNRLYFLEVFSMHLTMQRFRFYIKYDIDLVGAVTFM